MIKINHFQFSVPPSRDFTGATRRLPHLLLCPKHYPYLQPREQVHDDPRTLGRSVTLVAAMLWCRQL